MRRFFKALAIIEALIFIAFVVLFICFETDVCGVKEIMANNAIEHDRLFMCLGMFVSGGLMISNVRVFKTYEQNNPDGNTLAIGKNNHFNDIKQVNKGE